MIKLHFRNDDKSNDTLSSVIIYYCYYYCRLTIVLLPELLKPLPLWTAFLKSQCLHLLLNIPSPPTQLLLVHVDNVLLKCGSLLPLNQFLTLK